MNRETKKHYFLLSGLLFSFFITWSSCFSLISIWLKQLIKLTGEEIGFSFSAIAVVALCVQPVYGFIQDKLGLRKNLLWFVGLLLLLSGPFFIYIYGPLLLNHVILGSIAGGVYVGSTFFAGIGALESYTERVSRITKFEYGRARMWGSLGWATATFFAGHFININPNINFWIGSASAVIFLSLLFLLPVNKIHSMDQLEYGKTDEIRLKDALGLLKLPNFWALVVFVMGVSVYNIYDQQFSVYFVSLFPSPEKGNSMYGFLNSFQVFLEAFCMFLAPFLVNRIGAKNGLLLSGVIMALRIIGSGIVEGPLLISAMKLLHGIELPILLISIFKYISACFPARLSATLYLVGFQFITQVCASLMSSFAGASYDKLGFPTTYLIMGGLVCAFMLISSILLKSDRQVTT